MSDELNKDEIFEDKTENPNEPENSENLSGEQTEEKEEQREDSLNEETAENSKFSSENDVSDSDLKEENQSYPAGDVESLNKIEYSSDLPADDYKPASKGLKLFALVMASVMLLTATCLAGYFIGRNSTSAYARNKKVDVSLAQVPKDADALTPAQVYEKVKDSIVGIIVYNSAGSSANATGVIISEDGYIVTNDHIYSEIGAPKFLVYLSDGSERTAQYVAGDAISDLAVLKLDNKSGITAATLGDSSKLICGESVVAVGRPSSAQDNSTITSGIISLTERRVKTTSNYSAKLIQTDSAINPGSSGGALVNMYGQVVGITSSKLAGVQYDSIGFAIPTTTVSRVTKQLISSGKVTDRAKLGITYQMINTAAAEAKGLDNTGLLVISVGEDSDLYGKIQQGDMITHINGTEITYDDMVLNIIDDCKAGDTIRVTVVDSNGNTKEFSAKLKANIGESSYSSVINSDSSQGSSSSDSSDKKKSSDKEFDFPYGE